MPERGNYFTGKRADPEWRKQRAIKARAAALSVDRAIERVEEHGDELTAEQRLRLWAVAQAASLPPLSDQQVAAAARLATELDAEHARQDGAA